MRKRRQGLKRAAAGVVLAAGALGSIAWWNSAALRGHSARAASSVEVATPAVEAAAQPAGDHAAPAASTGQLPATQPAAVTTRPAAGSTTQLATPSSSAGVSSLLLEARQLQSVGKLLEARTLANTPLVAGQLSAEDATAAKAFLREVNSTLIFSPTRADGDPWVGATPLAAGQTLNKISNECLIPYTFLMRINHIESDRKVRRGQVIKTLKGPFHAVVDKRAFTLDIYLGGPGGPGSVYVTTFRVGLGAQDSTPVGLWQCTQGSKLKNPTYHSPRGEGIIAADDPNNPLGEYWIGLTGIEGAAVGKTSYGIHGTIFPDSIGKMESMGCIRLVNSDVEQVFQMLFEGKSTVRVIE